MELHELRPKNKKRREKRVGRGGKRGTTSSRGQKGQGARAGRKLRPAERDILLKFPKLRGVKNPAKNVKKRAVEFKVSQLDILFKGEKTITKKLFVERKLVSQSDKIKIIGNKDINTAFSVEGISVSKGAEKAIEKAGGKVVKS